MIASPIPIITPPPIIDLIQEISDAEYGNRRSVKRKYPETKSDDSTQPLKKYYNKVRDFEDKFYEEDALIIENAKEWILKEYKKYPNPAVVLDVDDTSLDHNFYSSDFGFPPLYYTLNLYRIVKDLKIEIFFITSRTVDKKENIELNLKIAGYEGPYNIYHCGLDEPTQNGKANIRKSIVEKGYSILANIGDCELDFGGYSLKDFKLHSYD